MFSLQHTRMSFEIVGKSKKLLVWVSILLKNKKNELNLAKKLAGRYFCSLEN